MEPQSKQYNHALPNVKDDQTDNQRRPRENSSPSYSPQQKKKTTLYKGKNRYRTK